MTESHWMILMGLMFLPFSLLAYKYPEIFMKGRRSAIWVDLLGEEKTKLLIRYFSVPLVVVIAVVLIANGILEKGSSPYALY